MAKIINFKPKKQTSKVYYKTTIVYQVDFRTKKWIKVTKINDLPLKKSA